MPGASSRARDLLQVTRPVRVHTAQFRQLHGRRIEALNGANGIGFRLLRRDRRQAPFVCARLDGENRRVFPLQIARQGDQRGFWSDLISSAELTKLDQGRHRSEACEALVLFGQEVEVAGD